MIQVPSRGRVIVFAFGSETSGIPSNWAATANRGGVNLLKNWSDPTVAAIAAAVEKVKRRGDIVAASIHWGGNWGYEISRKQRDFAHKLIDKARVTSSTVTLLTTQWESRSTETNRSCTAVATFLMTTRALRDMKNFEPTWS